MWTWRNCYSSLFLLDSYLILENFKCSIIYQCMYLSLFVRLYVPEGGQESTCACEEAKLSLQKWDASFGSRNSECSGNVLKCYVWASNRTCESDRRRQWLPLLLWPGEKVFYNLRKIGSICMLLRCIRMALCFFSWSHATSKYVKIPQVTWTDFLLELFCVFTSF